MKKYSNFLKYFNTVPRGWLLFLFVFYTISAVANVILNFLVTTTALSDKIASIVWAILLSGIFAYLYFSQLKLEKARIGKSLKKEYGLDGDSLTNALEEIDRELANPKYSDATKKRKYNSFFVTEHWIVGTEGLMLLRANAVKTSDVKSVEKGYLKRYHRGMTFYYFVVMITTKSDKVHQFYLRSEENVDMACEFLLNTLERA